MSRAPLVVIALAFAGAAAADKRPQAPHVDLADMVELSSSSFLMGAPAEPAPPYGNAKYYEQPQHEVRTRTFRLDRTEVTVADFALFLTYAGGERHFHRDQPLERVREGYLPVAGSDEEPMRQVTWEAAAHYCLWAGKRLPTEAEWERAAAGLEARPFPWGEEGANCRRAAYFTGASFCAEGPQPVGGRPEGATPEGVLDLAGNVAEWVADGYGPYSAEAQVDPKGPEDAKEKVIRGGGFLDGGFTLKTHARFRAPPETRSEAVGFRCAHSDDDAVPEARRGSLTAPADEGREETARPYAPGADSAEVLLEGLEDPGAIAFSEGLLWVAHRGRGEVLTLDPETREVQVVLEGLGDPASLVAGGGNVHVADRLSGEIWRLSSGKATLLVTDPDGPLHLAAHDDEVYWSTPDAIRVLRSPVAVSEDLAVGLDGLNGIALSATHLFFAEEGEANTTLARIASVPRGGGEVQTLVGQAQMGELRPTDVALDPLSGQVYFPVVQRGFPRSSLPCRVGPDGDAFGCLTYSPPIIEEVVVLEDHLYWSTRRTLASTSLAVDEPFALATAWTRAGGLAAADGSLFWTDRESGRVHRLLP